MPTFSDLLSLTYTASESLNAIEAAQRMRVESLFSRMESGILQYGTLRQELLKLAKAGYITGGSVAVQHVADLIKLQGVDLNPPAALESSDVLDRVLSDLVRNLEAYRDSDKDGTAFRRLRFRALLGIQTAVRRGFTDSQLAAANKISDQGGALHKMWLCSFGGNTPCPHCLKLHGVTIPLNEEFDHGDDHAPSVFLGLQGPPRHPNCHCYMIVYLVTPETTVVAPSPAVVEIGDKYMTTKDVRKLPRAVFTAVLSTLRLIAGILTGGRRGK